MAPNVTAHFFAANDINGSVLHEITDEDTFFRDLVLKLERDGLGSGDLTLSRMINFSGFASGTFQPEVFVRFIVHAYSDTVYYPWGFSQEKRQQIVVHRDEKGAEIFRFAGPGPKALLQRHALGIHDNLSTGHWTIDLINGVWRWQETASIGRVLARILDEDAARADPALPFLTYTFTQNDDSNGTPWADVDVAEGGLFEIPIGTDFLTILRDMDDMVELSSWIDLGTVASPKYELNVIQGLGDDNTGSAVGAGVCLLKEGLNITNDSLTVEGQNLRRASHVIVEGKDGAWKVAERPGFVSGDYVKYDKIEFTRTNNEDWLEKVGKRWLHRQDRGEKEVTIELQPGVSDATGYYFPAPDRVLWLDNIISVDTSYDGSNHTELDIQPSEDNLVTGLELSLGLAGETDTADATAKSWNIKAVLNKERSGTTRRTPNQQSGASGAGGCSCHNPPRFPPECPADPGVTTVVDWDWTACSNPSYVDAFAGGAPANPWGGGFATGSWGGDGCSSQTNHNNFSAKWAASPGDVFTVQLKSGKYGSPSGTVAVRLRFYNSAGAAISSSDVTFNRGYTSNNGGAHAVWITDSQAFPAAPALTAYAAITQTTWSNFYTQHVIVTTPGATPPEIADCFDYGGFDHGSSTTLPSDYLAARLQALRDAMDDLELDSLTDVDLQTTPPADNDVLTFDSGTSTWVPAAGGGGSGSVATDTIWDAKGDLAAGTGADTADNLTVGANDTILMADSAQTTGLKWAASATPSTQAFGDAAATGTADTFTRGDHKHAMPADPVTAHAAASDPHTGYVLESLLDAKGDLIGASANDTPAKIAAGTDGFVLTADSTQTAGVKWASAAASGGGIPTPWFVEPHNGNTGQSATTVGAANNAIFRPCVIPTDCTVTGIRITISTSSGSIDVGLYDATFNLVRSNGGSASPGTGLRTIAFSSSVAVTAGRYWLAVAANNNTVTFVNAQVTSVGGPGHARSMSTAYPLPNPAGSVSAGEVAGVNAPVMILLISGGWP